MPALHQLVDGTPRCGAELEPAWEGARTCWPCQPCRIAELEGLLREAEEWLGGEVPESHWLMKRVRAALEAKHG
jgi:hypothetical protein